MEVESSREVRYGGSSAELRKCPRCDRSPDQHPLANIRPSEETTAAVVKFSKLLQQHVLRLNELQQQTREEFMLGAIVARVGGKKLKWVANSGASILKVDSMDGDWTVIHEMPPELGDDACFGVGGLAFTPTLGDGFRRTECAAPKLLCNLLRLAGDREIHSIEMTELWWKNPVTKSETPNRNWAQLEPVPSCEHCRSFLPQMLCDKPDLGMEGFTATPVLPRGTQQRQLCCKQGHAFQLAVPDDAWRSYSAQPGGVSAPCPECRKDVPCHDAARPPAAEVECVHCHKAFLHSGALPPGTKVVVECKWCHERAFYTRHKVKDEPDRIVGKPFGKK